MMPIYDFRDSLGSTHVNRLNLLLSPVQKFVVKRDVIWIHRRRLLNRNASDSSWTKWWSICWNSDIYGRCSLFEVRRTLWHATLSIRICQSSSVWVIWLTIAEGFLNPMSKTRFECPTSRMSHFKGYSNLCSFEAHTFHKLPFMPHWHDKVKSSQGWCNGRIHFRANVEPKSRRDMIFAPRKSRTFAIEGFRCGIKVQFMATWGTTCGLTPDTALEKNTHGREHMRVL